MPSGGYKELFDLKSALTVSADAVGRALVLFGVRESADHEEASLWAFAWGAHMSDLGDRASRTSGRDDLNLSFNELRDTSADIVSHLVEWVKSAHEGELVLPPDPEDVGTSTTA